MVAPNSKIIAVKTTRTGWDSNGDPIKLEERAVVSAFVSSFNASKLLTLYNSLPDSDIVISETITDLSTFDYIEFNQKRYTLDQVSHRKHKPAYFFSEAGAI